MVSILKNNALSEGMSSFNPLESLQYTKYLLQSASPFSRIYSLPSASYVYTLLLPVILIYHFFICNNPFLFIVCKTALSQLTGTTMILYNSTFQEISCFVIFKYLRSLEAVLFYKRFICTYLLPFAFMIAATSFISLQSASRYWFTRFFHCFNG